MLNNVLVTGGAGFIGSNLVLRLADVKYTSLVSGHVDVVDDLSAGDSHRLGDVIHLIRFYETDFASDFILDRIRAGFYDTIFHLAAVPRVSFSVEQPEVTHCTNVDKTLQLLAAVRQATATGKKVRFVFSSSSSVYGGADMLPTPEFHLKSPKSPYALQKSIIEDYGSLYSSLYGVDFVSLRYFNVFGPNQSAGSPYATAVAAWLHAIKNGLPLRSDGDGTQSRDLCYVDNVVQANILAATRPEEFKGDRYNICCGQQTTNNEILSFLRAKFPNIQVQDAPWRAGDVMHTLGDYTAAAHDLGYEPQVLFWDGLERTLQWWNL